MAGCGSLHLCKGPLKIENQAQAMGGIRITKAHTRVPFRRSFLAVS